MDLFYKIWNNNNKLGNGPWSISGNSRAGFRTAYQIPELKIQLDAGLQSFNKVLEIFITHSHADHICSLSLIILENISHKLVTNIYCPKDSKTLIENMISSFLMCNYNSTEIPRKYFKIIPLDDKFLLELKLNNNDIKIKSFYATHTVPTLCYGLIDVKKKLKEEFKGLDKNELVSLKKKGVSIVEKVDFKRLVFCGDTSIDIFENNPTILEFENIVIECTFFEEEDLHLAKERKHMHWLLLRPVIESNPNVNFYLIHISAKYHCIEDLKEYLIGLNNVFIL